MQFSPRLQGLGTTSERGANIMNVRELSNENRKKRITMNCIKLQHRL
jgi:hypothetical protein